MNAAHPRVLLVTADPAARAAVASALAGLDVTVTPADPDHPPEPDCAAVLLDSRALDPARYPRPRGVPLLVLAPPDYPEADAYAAGAADVLRWPAPPAVLRAKVGAFAELHRAAADRVRAGEERFRAFMDNSPTAAWVTDPAGRIRYVSGTYRRMFRVPDRELVGATPEDLYPAEFAREAVANLRAVADSGRPVETVESAPRPDGSVGRFLVYKFPLPGPEPLVGGVAVDITDRVRVEAALRAGEDAQRFLAEAGEVLSASLDPDETLATVTRLVVPRVADWCSVYLAEPDGRLRQVAVAHADPAKVEWARELAARYPPDPAAPRGMPAVVRSGEPEFTPDVTDDMIVAGARDPAHLAILRGLGIRSVVVAPLTARGRTLGAVTLVTAESGRRYGPDDLRLAVDLGRRAGLAVDNARLFAASQESLRLLGLLVEASGRLTGSLDPAAVRAAILDLSGRLVAADAHAIWRLDPATGDWFVADSAGLSDEYLRSQGRIGGGGQMPDRPIVAEDAAGAAALEGRRAAYRAEGIASVLAAPLRIHGAVSGTLVFYYRTRRRFDDVTVRVATALADLAGAALGTAELYEREAASRRRAEEADRRKDEFLATVAHELRNPLAPIRNAVAVLRMAPAPATERVVRIMDRQVTQLVHLVDDLLDVARVTRGKITLRREPLDLRDAVEAAVEASRPLAEAAGHALAVDLPTDPLPVEGDRTRLTQVLTNLLNNAAKYTPDGGRIAVSAGREDGAAVVRVADTGVGIPAEMLPAVFEVFTQLGRDAARSQGGLGLGLALVRKLVDMHGGAAWAESPGPGGGSTFVVRLPLAG